MAHYATVTGTAPLMVLEDGAATAVPATKNALYSPAVNDRVVVETIQLDRFGTVRVWIIGEEG